MENNYLFDEYFDSVFRHSNVLSEKEYEDQALYYKMNYAKFLPSVGNAAILDIGCGAGHFLYYLGKSGYENYLGIDISPQQVNYCRKNISERVQVNDAFEYLKDKSGSCDAIVANDVLEHIPKARVVEFLSLVLGALKPEGVFLARTPNLGNPFALRLRYTDFTHETGLTEKSLNQVLWLAGFRNINILPCRDRGVRNQIVAGIIRYFISKLMWYQGFVAPEILTPSLVCAARKQA